MRSSNLRDHVLVIAYCMTLFGSWYREDNFSLDGIHSRISKLDDGSLCTFKLSFAFCQVVLWGAALLQPKIVMNATKPLSVSTVIAPLKMS